MKKFHKNYELCLTLYYECLSVTGEIDLIGIEYKVHLETLIAMGLELQKNLYDDLVQQLDEAFENNENVIAVVDFYCKLGYSQPSMSPVHLPLSADIGENRVYLQVENNVFIPKFRMTL